MMPKLFINNLFEMFQFDYSFRGVVIGAGNLLKVILECPKGSFFLSEVFFYVLSEIVEAYLQNIHQGTFLLRLLTLDSYRKKISNKRNK